jgi:hypothetical protein
MAAHLFISIEKSSAPFVNKKTPAFSSQLSAISKNKELSNLVEND